MKNCKIIPFVLTMLFLILCSISAFAEEKNDGATEINIPVHNAIGYKDEYIKNSFIRNDMILNTIVINRKGETVKNDPVISSHPTWWSIGDLTTPIKNKIP